MNKKFLSGLGAMLMLAASCSKEKMLVKENTASDRNANVSCMTVKPTYPKKWVGIGFANPRANILSLAFSGGSKNGQLCHRLFGPAVSLEDIINGKPTSLPLEIQIIDGRLYVKLKDGCLDILKLENPEIIDVQQIILAELTKPIPADIFFNPNIIERWMEGDENDLIECFKPSEKEKLEYAAEFFQEPTFADMRSPDFEWQRNNDKPPRVYSRPITPDKIPLPDFKDIDLSRLPEEKRLDIYLGVRKYGKCNGRKDILAPLSRSQRADFFQLMFKRLEKDMHKKRVCPVIQEKELGKLGDDLLKASVVWKKS